MFLDKHLLILIMFRLHLYNLLIQLHNLILQLNNNNLLNRIHSPVRPNTLHLLPQPLIRPLQVEYFPGLALQIELVLVPGILPLLMG